MVFVPRWRSLARLASVALAVVLVLGSPVWAQGQPATPRAKAADPKPAESRPGEPARPAELTTPSASALKPNEMLRPPSDPVVAIVEGHLIYLSDIGRAVPSLPENLRGLPFDTLFPVVLDRVIDHQALVVMARRQHLEDELSVRRDMDAATDRILEGALLSREAGTHVTEEAVQARYTQRYVGRPATEQARARHILVGTEAEARKLIDQLNKGADFPSLAQQYSKDPDGANGGDLGFFRRDQVWQEFADAAFSLQPGQFSKAPIHNEFGWHIVKVEERRIVAPPSYSEVHDALRQALMQEAVQQVIDQARADITIHKFNLDGSPMGAVADIRPAQPVIKQEDKPVQ